MRTVQNVDTIIIKVSNDELIDGKWLSFSLLSKKVSEYEKQNNVGYKSLKNKLYNSCACGKYNVSTIYGLKCINVTETMKGTASLLIKFEVA